MSLKQAPSSTAHALPIATDCPPAAVPRLDTGAVFGGGREVILVHRGQEYRLRITKAGKLILTK